ncbi:hypothetical protein BBJ28_00000555 [Nothophytophthora sp. Chile5]|nr:hypothetical protein BBJ28_00000555 [Nothophytophthora sp. Chile5]
MADARQAEASRSSPGVELLGGRGADTASSSSGNGNGNGNGNGSRLPDAESRRQLPPRGATNRSQRSVRSDNVSFLGSTPIEEFVAKYQVVKISWRGKYERIFALAPTRFCTIDPRDFEVTNTWPLNALLSINLDPSDQQVQNASGFTLTLKGTKKEEQLKLRCRFRSRLLSDLYRLKDQFQQRNSRPEARFSCVKWSRKGVKLSCALEFGMDGVTCTQPDGSIRSKYLYTEMEHLTLLSDSKNGFAIGYTGRSRLFFSDQRGQIHHRIQTAAEAIGCFIKARSNVTAEMIQTERAQYGLNHGEPFVQFNVRKITPKYDHPIDRTLSLQEKVLVELDGEAKVVACYNYSDIYVLVRQPTSGEQFEIQFGNGQVRKYVSNDRDGVLSAIYDICVTCEENAELFISCVVNQRGLRLLPFFAVEDTTETLSFFNDASIGSWYLQRMASVGKFGNSLKIGDKGFVEIVAEFNANVPASGIPYNTKHTIIGEALRPICAQLYYVAKTKPVATRSAVTLLQALFRIASSYYGFREIGQAAQISETITNLLVNGEEFAVFWTTLLLRRLTAHAIADSTTLDKTSVKFCEEVETYNKKVFFGNTYLVKSLIVHLEEIDVVPGNKKHSSDRHQAGPLVIMGLLQTLEGCLCSRVSTTGPAEFLNLVEEVAKFYSTLLKVLFQSRCATTVEACTLLLKTTLEECDPVVASSIRDAALTEGIVLRHFYQSLFDESFDQRCVSRYLVSLWMSHHDGSKQLLSRMIPSGFFHLLKEPPGTPAQIEELDRLERESMEMERQEHPEEFNDDDESLSFASDSTLRGGSAGWRSGGEVSSPADSDMSVEMLSRKTVSLGAIGATDDQLAALQSESRRMSVSNLPISEVRSSFSGERSSLTWISATVRDSFETPIENEQSKARMLRKLKSSVDGNSTKLKARSDHSRESQSRGSGSKEAPPRVRKRDVAISFFSGALSGGKKSHPNRAHKTSKGRHFPLARSNRTQENFRLLFHMLSRDHESIDMIWNKGTRDELRRALSVEIKRFSRFQISRGSMKARWNYEDFGLTYASLANEVVIGGCYVRILAHLRSKMSFFGTAAEEDEFMALTPEQVPIRNPGAVLSALYVRILRENIHAEYRDDLETSILCIKSMGIVAAAHAGFVNAVDFDEICHLGTLMGETVHAAMLENFLHTVRALCLHPGNARRVLGSEQNLELVVQLLQLAHSTSRGVENAVESRKLWLLETDEGEQLGPFSVNELKQKRDEGHIDMSTFYVKRQEDVACEPSMMQSKVMEIGQLRWEIGILGDLHPLQAAHDAISILLSVARSNSLLESNSTHDASGNPLSAVFPPPRGKTTLWGYVRRILPVLARCNHPKLCEKVATLLEFLYTDNQPLGHSPEEDFTNRASLEGWGLFYLAFVGETSEFKSIAGLLKATHRLQAGLDGVSALTNILPEDMINLLDTSSPTVFSKVFCEGMHSPQVIWSAGMRMHLHTQCVAHLQDYAEALEEDVSREWRYCPMAPVAFTELLAELNDAYKVLTCPRPTLLSAGHDPVNLLLVLHSLVIMCNRYPEKLNGYEFDSYDLLLPLLAAHCSAEGVPPEGTTKQQAMEISLCSAELIYNTCAVSMTNGDLLLDGRDLSTLEKVVNFCIDSIAADELADHTQLLEVCFFVLQTITGLMASPRGRDWMAQSTTLLVDMVRILWLWNHPDKKSFFLSKITQQVLEGISRMALLEKNQELLVQRGVLWQLFLQFSTYDVELDDVTVRSRLQNSIGSVEDGFADLTVEVENLLAIMAVRALCRLGGCFAEGSELQSPSNSLVKRVVDSLMTPNLAELLLLSSHHEFLKIFHGECESYTLFWNREMRQELLAFLSPRASVAPVVTTVEPYTEAIHFRFEYLAELFYVGGLYVEMLMGSLLVIEQSLVPIPVPELGLTGKFFRELFSFIDSGELVCPQYIDADGNSQNLPPYAGWRVDKEQLTTMDRVTALNCLSITTTVAPKLVEKHIIMDNSAMKMVLRLLFPPDNEVHQSEDAGQSLVLTPQLYRPCRLHCIATLQVLSTLDDFGKASLAFGICDILIELVHICQDVGPEVLGIIRNLCAHGAGGDFVAEILQSGCYLEFIGWVLLVEEIIVDDEFDVAERLRVPSALILSEMVKDGAPLSIESRRALCRFFPPAIADHSTPELVWNVEFRNHQRNHIIDFLNIFFSATSMTETEDGNFTSVVDSFTIDYNGLYEAPMAGNVYLTLFMEDPTFNLHDPLYVPNSAFALPVNTWLLEKVAELQIPDKCCHFLNETVRSQACEPCVVNAVRILRVCTISPACLDSLQPMCSMALSCLMAIINPIRGGPLHFESAYVLETMRRIILRYSEHGGRDATTGIVYIAGRLDLFGFMLNILENPEGIGKVKEPNVVRAEAIEHKKWEKKYKYESTDVVMATSTEDPFLQQLHPEADRVMREKILTAWSDSNSVDEITGFDVLVNGQKVDGTNATTQHYELYGLGNNTAVTFQVNAVFTAGSTASPLLSDQLSVSTSDRSKPGIMGSPELLTVTGGLIQVRALPPLDTGGADLSNLTVVVRREDDLRVTSLGSHVLQDPDFTLFEFYGLDALTTYVLSAFTSNVDGLTSTESDRLRVTTKALQLAGPCPAPTVLNATGKTMFEETQHA